MKTKAIIGVIALLAVSLIAYSQMRKSVDPKCATFPREGRLDVNVLMDAPNCASGKVEIQGTVNALHPEKKALILIDLSEEDNCEDGCPIRRLPVSWAGAMPAKGDRVTASGRVREEGKKFVFVAGALGALPRMEEK